MRKERLQEALQNAGELMVVLESDREYDLHPHDTEIFEDTVQTEGMKDGDYVEVTFPLSRVEHYYLHREA